jgi:hypothetical protein
VNLSASVSDLEQGAALGSSLSWTSNRDGALGTGTSLSHVLSAGKHTIVASVTDETGLTGAAQVTVTLQAPAGSGCGIGPELVPLLAGLLGVVWHQASRATPKRSR